MTYFQLYIIKVVKGIESNSIPLLLEPSYAIYYMEKGGDIYGRYQTVSDKSSSRRPPEGPKVYQPELLKSRTVVKDKYGMKHVVRRVRINDHAYREYYES